MKASVQMPAIANRDAFGVLGEAALPCRSVGLKVDATTVRVRRWPNQAADGSLYLLLSACLSSFILKIYILIASSTISALLLYPHASEKPSRVFASSSGIFTVAYRPLGMSYTLREAAGAGPSLLDSMRPRAGHRARNRSDSEAPAACCRQLLFHFELGG